MTKLLPKCKNNIGQEGIELLMKVYNKTWGKQTTLENWEIEIVIEANRTKFFQTNKVNLICSRNFQLYFHSNTMKFVRQTSRYQMCVIKYPWTIIIIIINLYSQSAKKILNLLIFHSSDDKISLWSSDILDLKTYHYDYIGNMITKPKN